MSHTGEPVVIRGTKGMTQATGSPLLTGTTDGQRWELLSASVDMFGKPVYRVRLDGVERWAGEAITAAIRTELDPEWAARRREIAQRRADEEAARVRIRAENAARIAECERDGKRVYVRYGFARSGFRSTNHRDGTVEAGLSVYAAWQMPSGDIVLDLRDVDAISFTFSGFASRQMYLATGALAGTGSDGEPILGRFRLTKVDPTDVEIVT